jgi:hypothetical protein
MGRHAYANLPSEMCSSRVRCWDAADVAAALKKLGYRISGDKPLTQGTREAITGAAEAFAAKSTGSGMAVVRADWFVFAASQPPLHHDLFRSPLGPVGAGLT